MLVANPCAAAPSIRIPLPLTGRHRISIGIVENYSDRLLIKLERDRCFEKITHGDVVEAQSIQECWWKDVELAEGDALVLQQDAGMKRRCGIAYIRIHAAPAPTPGEIPFITLMDGGPGNNGPLPLDEMVGEELLFRDTQVTELCHGTDICGSAQYNTKLPAHRYPVEVFSGEELISAEYYPWINEQLLKFEKAGRCTLRESIEAAHSIGRKLYAYHRMGITRLYAPVQMFQCPLYDQHPEWRCVDWDGTPISRLSLAYPEVRQFFLDHLRETVEFGADGVCLVFARGWPLVLFETPVADEFKRRTGKDMKSADTENPDILQVRTDIFNAFMRDVRKTVTEAGRGRETKVIAAPLALPRINRHYAMDCETWAREGLVQTLCPYPYGFKAEKCAIDVKEWMPLVKNTATLLCPVLNRMTYEPAGIIENLPTFLDRAENWLEEGAHGFSMWDLDCAVSLPLYRLLAYHVASKAGRQRLRELGKDFYVRHALKTVDGITVDRYHPGWNV